MPYWTIVTVAQTAQLQNKNKLTVLKFDIKIGRISFQRVCNTFLKGFASKLLIFAKAIPSSKCDTFPFGRTPILFLAQWTADDRGSPSHCHARSHAWNRPSRSCQCSAASLPTTISLRDLT